MRGSTPTLISHKARRLWVGAIGGGLTQVGRTMQALGGLTRMLEGVALSTLTTEELAQVTDHCYRTIPQVPRRELFEWERTWLERDLPDAPAHVLVGGSGDGRELAWLQARGYGTTAFDPQASGSTTSPFRARYEDLLEPEHPSTRHIDRGATYGAVLLGWGSFTHVAGAARRQAVLKRMRELSDGPLLMSYWTRHGGTRSSSRARDVGISVGRRLRRNSEIQIDPGDTLAPHCGYGHRFTREEILALAESAGYDAHVYDDGFAHATLRPRA